jgi:hypothetical protein
MFLKPLKAMTYRNIGAVFGNCSVGKAAWEVMQVYNGHAGIQAWVV